MSIRSYTTFEPHVVQHRIKHEAVEQANIDMPSPKPCTKNVSTSVVHTTQHSRPARPLTKGHKSTTENQGKVTRQTHVGQHNNKHVAMEQVDHERQSPKQCTKDKLISGIHPTEHSPATSPVNKERGPQQTTKRHTTCQAHVVHQEQHCQAVQQS